MTRPTINTPDETTVAVLRALVDWTTTYRNELRAVFGPSADPRRAARELADALEEADDSAAADAEDPDADEVLRAAIEFIHNMQLAAEALQFEQPDALRELHAIFKRHAADCHRDTTPS